MTAAITEPEFTDPPPDDQVESPAEAADEFRTGAAHLFAASANMLGTTSVDGDVVAGNKVVHLHTDLVRAFISGSVPARYLHPLLDRFAKPPNYERLVSRLRADRILILRGPVSSGRRMAALSLLAEVLGRTAPLVVLDPAITPDRLVDQFQAGTGHVLADPVLTADSPLHQPHLFAARELLERSNGYLVITIDHQAAVDQSLEETHDWRRPAPLDVLDAHLAASSAPDAYGNVLELPETKAFLQTGPSPAETAGFAQTALSYLDGEVPVEELAAYGASAARELARRVFGGAGYTLRDKAFAIALAVYDGSPYALVAAAGDDLYRAFQQQEDPDRTAAVSVFGTDRTARLELTRAVEYDAEPGHPAGRLTGYRYRSTWLIMLRHVWSEHPASRSPIVGWLLEMAEGSRTIHGIRAAVAAGCLANQDFDSVLRHMITPWATSPHLRTRHLAAWALSTAIDQGAEPQVRQVLRYWAEGSAAKRWTVVRTVSVLANLQGRSSLGLLATVARNPAQDERLNQELVNTLADLLTGPLSRQTLGTLVAWSQAGGQLRPLAHQAFLRATTRGRAAQSGGALLIQLVGADPLSRPHHVTLWRLVINDKVTRPDARRSLTRLVLLAASDTGLEAELAQLFAELAASPNELARLDHLLRNLPPDATQAARSAAERIRHRLSSLSIDRAGANHEQL